jgi:hypothetical protein
VSAGVVHGGTPVEGPGLFAADPLLFRPGTAYRYSPYGWNNYGLGWKVETVTLRGAPARLIGHRGTPIGGTTSLMTFPDHRLAIAVTSNVSFANGVVPFGLKLAELFAPPRHSN